MRRDPAFQAQQKAALDAILQRGFSDTPGFVTGLWMFDGDAGETVIVTTIDSLVAAQRASPRHHAQTLIARPPTDLSSSRLESPWSSPPRLQNCHSALADQSVGVKQSAAEPLLDPPWAQSWPRSDRFAKARFHFVAH